jgi:hypothetical protein
MQCLAEMAETSHTPGVVLITRLQVKGHGACFFGFMLIGTANFNVLGGHHVSIDEYVFRVS